MCSKKAIVYEIQHVEHNKLQVRNVNEKGYFIIMIKITYLRDIRFLLIISF
jgi:biotin operon repressor